MENILNPFSEFEEKLRYVKILAKYRSFEFSINPQNSTNFPISLIKIPRIPIPKIYLKIAKKYSNIENTKFLLPNFARITTQPSTTHIKLVSRKMVEWIAEQEGTRAWATDKRASISVYMRCMLAYQRGIGSAKSPYLLICNLNNFPRRASGRRGGYLPASFCPGNEMVVVATPLPPSPRPVHVCGQSRRRDATAKITPRREHA